MTEVIIGIDSHKGSHTAVAVDQDEQELGRLRVTASAWQLAQLRRWAMRWPQRRWAIEGTHGLGRLVAQQLVAVDEQVVDVQPKLAARVRLLDPGQVNKNDPKDARSVAIAALRATALPAIVFDDDTAVMKMWARRRRDLGSAWTQTVCRLHAVLCDLVPGGFARRISVARRLARVVAGSRTTITDIHGVGPVIAATVPSFVGDITRLADRDRFAAYNDNAPIEVSSGARRVHRLSRRGNRQINHALHMAAVTQIRNLGTAGYDYYHRKRDEGMGRKAALRALKRKIGDTIYQHLITDARAARKDPGGHTGNDSDSSAAGAHPAAPTLRTSHSRVTGNPMTVPTTTGSPTARRSLTVKRRTA